MAMTDAEKLFFAGGAHARAAHMLVAAAKTNIHMSVPFYLLLGFSLETILKAAYIHLGGQMKFAKQSIGHDLTKALASAKDNGFVPENQHLEWLTATMTDVHRSHLFRYLSGDGELRVADQACGLGIVDDLVVQVGQLLYPQHDRLYWIELLTKFES
ncbi:MAG: hypothetical protein ABL918_06890 [Chakrabartia sp.]